jgi:anthranilate synthase component 2
VKTLLVDAFDSFSHIIYQYLGVIGLDVEVVRSRVLTPEQVLGHSSELVVLGPGPGHPVDSGHVEIVRAVAGHKPILGVCLGHQSIAVAFGGVVSEARHIMHGKTSRILHDGTGMFASCDGPVTATRYHSLIVEEESLPADLAVTARSADDGYIMGLRHRRLAVEGVQFHPESVLTSQGLDMFRAFVERTAAGVADPGTDRAADDTAGDARHLAGGAAR